MAKGFMQTYCVDYEETFTPMAKLKKIKMLISLAIDLDQPLQQPVVKNAFLNGDLLDKDLPPGFEGNTNNQVCRLRKSLYELKQLLGFGLRNH